MTSTTVATPAALSDLTCRVRKGTGVSLHVLNQGGKPISGRVVRGARRPILIHNEAAADEVLVGAAKMGDFEAFEVLLRRHQPRIQRMCSKMVPNHEDAKDAVQATQIALWRKIGQFEGRSKFTTWLYQVTLTTTIGELRRRRPEPVETDLTVASDAPDPASTAADVSAVRWALARLPESYRATVILSDFERLTHAEIAEILIISEGTVKSRLSRAHQALAQMLTEEGR